MITTAKIKYKADLEAARAKLAKLEQRRDTMAAKKAAETTECERFTNENWRAAEPE